MQSTQSPAVAARRVAGGPARVAQSRPAVPLLGAVLRRGP